MDRLRALIRLLGDLSGALQAAAALWALLSAVAGVLWATARKTPAEATLADYLLIGVVSLLVALLPVLLVTIRASRLPPAAKTNPNAYVEKAAARLNVGDGRYRQTTEMRVRARKPLDRLVLGMIPMGSPGIEMELRSRGKLLGPVRREGHYTYEVEIEQLEKGDRYHLEVEVAIEDSADHPMEPFLSYCFDGWAGCGELALTVQFDDGCQRPVYGQITAFTTRKALAPFEPIAPDGATYTWNPGPIREGCRYTLSWVR